MKEQSGRGESEAGFDPGAESGGHEVEFRLGRTWDAGEEVIRALDEENLARL
jgi:hypothetical protein